MSMSKKDYVAIAAAFKQELGKHPFVSVAGRDRIRACVGMIVVFADVAAKDNGQFDRTRFYEACGMSAEQQEKFYANANW